MIDYNRLSVELHNSRFVEKNGIKLKIGLRDQAKLIGSTYATLSRIERGAKCDLETYVKICNFLNVSMDEFKSE